MSKRLRPDVWVIESLPNEALPGITPPSSAFDADKLITDTLVDLGYEQPGAFEDQQRINTVARAVGRVSMGARILAFEEAPRRAA